MTKDSYTTYRNPVYIAYVLAGLGLLILCSAIIDGNSAGIIEVAIFRIFNALPNILSPIFLLFSTFGTIAFAMLLALIFLIKKRYKAAVKVLLASIFASLVANFFRFLEFRPKPELVIDNVNVRQTFDTQLGFPSVHVAIATAVALVMYQYLPAKYHKYITISVILVAVSRLYLGADFPVDLIAGYAVGLAVGSAVLYIFGRRIIWKIPKELIKNQLIKFGFDAKNVVMAKVDARGSAPFFVEDTKGKNYFVKVVGKDNFIADWLFKLTRKIMYRRLEDESPFLSPKRQIEHESYVAGLALANGIRTPKIVGVFKVDEQNWGQIQEAIDGKSLDKIDVDLVTDKVLAKIWQLVDDLHKARIVHRDLRSANIFLAKDSEPWLIDFGFAEASADSSQTYRDNVELIASLSLLVGVKRSVDSAYNILGKKELQKAAPYLSYAVLSGATTKNLKEQKGAINDLRQYLSKKLNLNTTNTIRMNRIYLGRS